MLKFIIYVGRMKYELYLEWILCSAVIRYSDKRDKVAYLF